jgi:hypothetical protein
MSVENSHSTIELPELTSTNFDLASADVQIATGEASLVYPQLTLEGEDDAFEHSFEKGCLTVDEKPTSGTVVTNIVGGRVSGSVVIGSFNNVSISGGSIRVNGMDIQIGDSASYSSARRRALLLLPQGYSASHHIDTMSGDIDLEGLTARVLRVYSKSGDIALRISEVQTVILKTMSGDLEIEDTKSLNPVAATSMSGDIDVLGGEAPSWQLSTMSGDVTVKGTMGKVDASTMSGRTRVAQ